MSLINIVSALGNNKSIYPLLVRDLAIENLAKCTMTYTQNAKESKFIAREATRERIVDEYGTSAVWLGGAPLMGFLSDKVIKKLGLSPKVNLKLFNESEAQGIDVNIKKFKDIAKDAVADLEKVKANKSYFQKIQLGKFFATTAIPIAVMGFVLPKLNYLYTQKKLEKGQKQTISVLKAPKMDDFVKNAKKENKNSQISFTGLETLANMSDLNKMMIMDGGLTVGRVKTGRNKAEKAEIAFKMAGMCFLNYIAPSKIEKILNKLTKAIFGINTTLDVKLLDDKNFLEQIKNGTLLLPSGNSEKEIIDFIDKNINSTFVQQAKKMDLVSTLENGVRDPRKYVDTEAIASFKGAIEEFIKDAGDNIEEFAKKALKAKSFNTIVNVCLSSFLLAVCLPKVQFLFRKLITGSNLDPGIKDYAKK